MTAQSIETAVPATATGAYDIDPSHSNLGFVARHAMVTKVRGNFSDISGSLTLDVANPAASSAEVTVEVASVDTRNAQRDEHRVGDARGDDQPAGGPPCCRASTPSA